MNEKGDAATIFIIAVFVGMFALVYFTLVWPLEKQSEGSPLPNGPSDPFNASNELHFTHMPITYTFEKVTNETVRPCTLLEKAQVEEAIYRLTASTQGSVRFAEGKEDSDIRVICLRNSIGGSIIRGDYTATNKTILHGTILIPETTECKAHPELELQSLLHVLGIPYTNENLIMDPEAFRYANCTKSEIYPQIVDELKTIYPR